MNISALSEADRLIASLSPAKRESVREIVIDAARRGHVSDSARRFLNAATGSGLVADVLAAAIEDFRSGPTQIEPAPPSRPQSV
jgi:hypothetical protein